LTYQAIITYFLNMNLNKNKSFFDIIFDDGDISTIETTEKSKFYEDYKRWKSQNPDQLFPLKPKEERDMNNSRYISRQKRKKTKLYKMYWKWIGKWGSAGSVP